MSKKGSIMTSIRNTAAAAARISLATAMAGALGAGLAGTAQAHRILPSTRSGIHQFTGLQGRSSHRFSSSELATIGRSSDIVTGLAVQIKQYGPALRRANGHVRLFVYVNGMFAQSSQANEFPNSWYLHTRSGSKIRSSTHGNYLMNPFSRTPSHGAHGWAAYVAQQCVQKRKEAVYARGCFLDQMSSVGNTAFVSGQPINPKTGRPFSMHGYMGAVARVGNRAARAMPIIGNSYESGARYYSNDTRRVNRTDMRAFEAEHWLGATQPRDGHSLSTWKKNIQMVMSAQRHRKGVLLSFGDMSASVPQWQSYVVASMLLANNGRVWLHFDTPSKASWQLQTRIMHIAIGRPLRTARRVGGYFRHGVYRRRFTHGLVIVNPTGHTIAIHLSHPRRSPNGNLTTHVTAAPFSGTVLTG
jgi:hypothetical protein